MEKFNRLMQLCKASIRFEFNPHQAIYETVDEYVRDWGNGDEREQIDSSVYFRMVQLDRIVFIQFYPNTPTGFYTVWHYDVEAAIDQCLAILE